MAFKHILQLVFWLNGINPGVAYPTGAPDTVCVNHVPHHGNHAQQFTPPPYAIELTPDSYSPGDTITVRLYSPLNETFRGYQVRAQQVGGNIEQFIGAFPEAPENTKLQAWYPDQLHERNCFTHALNVDRTELLIRWRAPPQSVGDVIFSGTILKDYEHFWVNVTSDILSANQPAAVNYPPLEVGNSVADKDFVSGCGVTKGCIRHPADCSRDCEHVITYSSDVTSGMVDFQVFVLDAPAFLAIGFSNDTKMGYDSTVTCVQNDDVTEVHYGFSPAYYNEPHKLNNTRLQSLAVERGGSALYCTFQRSLEDSVLKYDFLNYQPYFVHFDLTQPHYVFLAWGTVYQGTAVPVKHSELPLVSTTKVDFMQPLNHAFNVDRDSPSAALTGKSGQMSVWAAVTCVSIALCSQMKHSFSLSGVVSCAFVATLVFSGIMVVL